MLCAACYIGCSSCRRGNNTAPILGFRCASRSAGVVQLWLQGTLPLCFIVVGGTSHAPHSSGLFSGCSNLQTETFVDLPRATAAACCVVTAPGAQLSATVCRSAHFGVLAYFLLAAILSNSPGSQRLFGWKSRVVEQCVERLCPDVT